MRNIDEFKSYVERKTKANRKNILWKLFNKLII